MGMLWMLHGLLLCEIASGITCEVTCKMTKHAIWDLFFDSVVVMLIKFLDAITHHNYCFV